MSQRENESSSGESVVDDIDKDPDFILSSASPLLGDTRSDYKNEEFGLLDIEAYSDNVVIDFIDFDGWDDVSLDTIPKRKTISDVWNYFGILKKGGSIFKPMSKKFFCRPCFDERKFKRWVRRIFDIFVSFFNDFFIVLFQLRQFDWLHKFGRASPEQTRNKYYVSANVRKTTKNF